MQNNCLNNQQRLQDNMKQRRGSSLTLLRFQEWRNMPYWLMSVIAFVLAAIAYDKKWHRLKFIFYLIGLATMALQAIQLWVGALSAF